MKTIEVADRFRTNDLSLQAGGKVVTVVYSNDRQFIYDKIKFPKYYVARIHGTDIKHGDVVAVYVNGLEMNLDLIYETARKKRWV